MPTTFTCGCVKDYAHSCSLPLDVACLKSCGPSSPQALQRCRHAEACCKPSLSTWQSVWTRRCRRLAVHGAMSDEAVEWPSWRNPGKDCDLMHLGLSGSHSLESDQVNTVNITRIAVHAHAGIWGGVDSAGCGAHRGIAEPPIFQMRVRTRTPEAWPFEADGPQLTAQSFA